MICLIILLLLFMLAYVYVGYPLLLPLMAKLFGKQIQKDESHLPTTTLVVSCFNEEDVIKEKIANCLRLDYPQDRLEIIFVSDGSTDNTDAIIKQHTSANLQLIRQEGRLGKTSGLNLALAQASGEIVVFSDANAMYDPQAIRKLNRNFIDASVGYVVGAAIYTDGESSAAAKSEDSYWQYELRIKNLESQLHSVVGGDGAIYAIRKELYKELDRKDINDFVNPLQIIEQGFRGVFEPEAKCFEETAGEFRKEARRKQRIVNRSFRGLMKVSSVMNPMKTGFFAFEVISHKLLRWFVPVMLISIAMGTVWLSYAGYGWFQLLFLLEVIFLWLAIVGYLKQSDAQLSPCYFYPYYFLMVNFYSLMGILQALSGNIQVTWESPRGAQDADGPSAGSRVVAMMLGVISSMLLLHSLS